MRRSSLPDVQASLHGCTAECRCSIASSRESRNALLAIAGLPLAMEAGSYTIAPPPVNAAFHAPHIVYEMTEPEDYSQGEAFQTEKRTVFSTAFLPLCAEGQLANA